MDATIGKLKEALELKRDLEQKIARSENENTQGLHAQIHQQSLAILHRKPPKSAQSLMRQVCDEEGQEGLLRLVDQFGRSKAMQQSRKQIGQLDKLFKELAESGEETHHRYTLSPAHSKRRDHLYERLARTNNRIVGLYGQLYEAELRMQVRQCAKQMNLPTKTPKQMGRRNAEVGSVARALAPRVVERQLEEAGIDSGDIMDVEIAWRRRTLTAVTAVREASIATAHRADREPSN